MSATDHELLRRYSKENCEEAFAELTRRHLDLAWGAAVRITGDADLARENAQLVANQLQRQLSAQTLGIANREPQIFLGLF